jgi:hypothetical protein
MKRLILVVGIFCIVTSSSQAARQGNNVGQKRYLRLSVPSEQRPRLLLPSGNTVELSALSMLRDETSVMHLEGDVEIKTFWPGANPGRPLTVLHADVATYNLNTGEIDVRSKMNIRFENPK